MKKYIFFLITAVLLVSCSNDDSEEQFELIGKTFDHLFFATEQECIDSQPNPNIFINCHQELSFIDDQTAEIILTDNVYIVQYSVNDSQIFIHSSASTIEFQNDIVFERINSSSLRRVDNNTTWNVRTGDSIWG